MKTEDLFTRISATEAKPMPITTVDGQATGHFFQVLGSESTPFIQARREFMRRAVTQNGKLNNEEEHERSYAKLVASLVVGWDLDTPYSKEAAEELFYQAPHLGNKVDQFAAHEGNLTLKAFNEAKKSSSTGQEKASS